MSLITQKQFRVGIIAAKSFDDPDFLSEKLGPHLLSIICLYTNGVNSMVTEFARVNGLTYTVYPPTKANTILWSNSRVIENSDKVFILSTPESKNAKTAKEQCEKAGVKYEVFERDPITPLKAKVDRIKEIVDAVPDDVSEDLKTVMAVIKKGL